MQLRHARLVHANLRADLLHGDVAVVVKANHLALARRQRSDRGLHALLDFEPLVGGVRRFRLRRHQGGGQARFVHVFAGGQRRGGFDGGDPHDGAAQSLFVGAHFRGKVRDRRLVAQLASQRFARGFELTALAAHAARPGVAAQRVDHRAADAPLGKGFELDAAPVVEAVGGVDQSDDAVLHQVPDVDGVRHRRRHASGQGFHVGNSRDDAAVSGRRSCCWARISFFAPLSAGGFRRHALYRKRGTVFGTKSTLIYVES